MVKRRPRAEQNTPSDRHADDRVWQSKAIWLDGKVPRRFWEDPGNRRLYLEWLGHTLGFQSMEDWYRVTTDDFKRHHGAAILGSYWSDSAIVAVQECFPEYDWKEWLFPTFRTSGFGFHGISRGRQVIGRSHWRGPQGA